MSDDHAHSHQFTPPSHPSSSRPPRPPSFPRPRPRYFPPPVPRRPRSAHSNVYIPPFRQRQLDAAVPDPPATSTQYGQNRAWTSMKKRINYIVNIVNSDNVALCAKALFRLNIIRARGILVKKLLRHQLASPALSPVFACLIAIIGSRFPQVAELLVTRLIAQLKDAYANQDRVVCFATARFIAHLFNQQVVTDLLLLEFLSTCTLDPSDGSIELAVVTLQECTSLLSEKSPRPLELIFQRLRQVLHDGDLSRRVQVMIEDLIAMRRKTLSSEATLDPRLDLLDEEDIITHLASLDDEQERDLELECDGFQFDPDFEENERIYELIKRDILGAEADAPDFLLPFSPGNSNVSSKGKDGESDAQTSALAVPGGTHSKDSQDTVKDMTESESLEFRRTVYLTITSGLSSEEWAHKLTILMRKYPGRELDLCQVIIECCSQEKTFLRPYGLLGQRFCMMDGIYVSKFEELFATHYATIHQFKVRKILNMANFYSFLFACDSLPWSTFQIVRIVESETTQSSRIFLKQLLREMAKTMGKTRLKEHFADHSARGNLSGLLPTDCAENAKYAIRFFKNIELEYLAEELEGILSTLPNLTQPDDDDGDDSSVSSSVSSDSASSSSLSESSGIDDVGSAVLGRAASVGSGGRDVHQQHLYGAASESVSKRGVEESSLDHSHRPTKLRRRTVGDPEPSEDTRTAAGADFAGGGGGATVGALRRGYDISSDRRRERNEEGPFNRDNDNTHSRQSGGSKSASLHHGSGAAGTGTAAGNALAVVGPRVRDDDSDSDMEAKRNRLRDRERRRGDAYASGSGGGSSGTNNKNISNEKKYGVRQRHRTSSRSRRGYMDDDFDDDDNDMVISRRSNHRVKSSSKNRDKKERRSHSHSHSRSHSHSYHDDSDGSSQSDADYHSNDDRYSRRRPSDQRMRDRDRDRSRRYVDVSYDEPYGSDRRDSRGRRADGVGSKRRSRKKDYVRSSSRRVPKGRDRGRDRERDRDMPLSDSEDDRLSLRSRSMSRSRSLSRSSRSRSRSRSGSRSRSMSRSRSVSVSPQRRSSRRYYSGGGSGSGSGTGGGGGGGGGMDRYGRRPSERGEQASG